jgi:hypothetical protein
MDMEQYAEMSFALQRIFWLESRVGRSALRLKKDEWNEDCAIELPGRTDGRVDDPASGLACRLMLKDDLIPLSATTSTCVIMFRTP